MKWNNWIWNLKPQHEINKFISKLKLQHKIKQVNIKIKTTTWYKTSKYEI